MGERSAEPEYMEEDFFHMKDDEDDLCFDLNNHTNEAVESLPLIIDRRQLCDVGELQQKQIELKRKIFEASESTIIHNKRAHIKRIKQRNYLIGQKVLFRNPESAGLASTLNVRGTVMEKIGRDLYKVKYRRGRWFFLGMKWCVTTQKLKISRLNLKMSFRREGYQLNTCLRKFQNLVSEKLHYCKAKMEMVH